MRILIIKQLWNPEPTAKSLDFALELKKRGHEVHVLTGFPSYPLGKIYSGFKQKLWSREEMKGIQITRVPIYPDHSSNGKKRMLHYLSYAFSASLLGPFLMKKADVAFVYQGAIPVGIPATVFKWFRGVRFVYDINDLWPETVEVSGMMKNKRLLTVIERWNKFNLNRATHISVATNGFKKKLESKGVEADKLHFIPNWSRDQLRTSQLPNEQKERFFPSDKTNILYAGNLGVVQSLYTILDGMRILKEQGERDINLILLGGGAEEVGLKEYTKAHELSEVTFLPRVSGEEVGHYLNSADVLLVHLKKTDLFSITIPSKILSYLRSAKPILMGLSGDAAEIVTDANAGLLFEPDNADDFVNKVLQLHQMGKDGREALGKNGPIYYDNNLSIQSSTDKLELLMKEIADLKK